MQDLPVNTKKEYSGETMSYMESDIGRVWGRLAVLNTFQAKGVNLCNMQGSFTRATVFSLYFVSVDQECERCFLSSYIQALCWTLVMSLYSK